MTKKCKECNQLKLIEQFYKNINCTIDGYTNQCTKCINKKQKIFRDNNKEEIKRRAKIFRDNNKEKVREADRIYSQTERGKEVRRKNRLKWIKDNPERNKAAKEKWSNNNKHKKKEYYQKNKKRENQKNLERRKGSVQKSIRHNISNLIVHRLKKRSLTKEGKSIFDFVPYTIEQLIQRLESQWESWMNWNNYGLGKNKWNRDHIIPDNHFNYTSVDDAEFQACEDLENIRPMEAIKNISKGKRLDYDKKQDEVRKYLNNKYNLNI